MKIVTIIPARGGSKGIPRKNLRLLGGQPLLYYSIRNALNSNYTLDIFVSSEDDEILNTAQKFGAKTHKRNQNIANDYREFVLRYAHLILSPSLIDSILLDIPKWCNISL